MTIRARLSTTLLVALSLDLRAQTDPKKDPRELLIRSGGPAVGARTIRLTGTFQANPLFGGLPEESSFVFEASIDGGKARRDKNLTINGRPVNTIRIFDGITATNYTSFLNTYSSLNSTYVGEAAEIGRWAFGRDPNNFSDPVLEGEETLEVNGKPMNCSIIHANYRSIYLNPPSDHVIRTVSICGEQNLILKDVWEMNHLTGRLRNTTRYTGIEWNIPIDPSRFVFEPPPGSKLMNGVGGGIGSIIGAVPSSAPPVLRRTRPAVTKRVEPIYTEEARRAKLEGAVNVYVEVTPDGTPENVQILEGLGLGLDQQAVAAVQQWQFQAGQRSGNIAQSVEVRFRLPSTEATSWQVTRAQSRTDSDPKKTIHTISRPLLSAYTSPDSGVCAAEGPGAVEVELEVSGKGEPIDPTVRPEAKEPLKQAALAALASWRFQPGTIDGKRQPFHFTATLDCGSGNRAEAESPAKPLKIGGSVTPPRVIHQVEPRYGEEARKAKLQGMVVVNGVVDISGRATDLFVSRGLGMGLDIRALEAVRQWRFRPGSKDGTPVPVFITVEVSFRLL